MTRFLAIVCVLALTTGQVITANAQLRKIPAEVTGNFAEKYPDATDIEWKDKLTAFTAGFNLDSVWYLATFNNEGEWVGTEHEIEVEEMPGPVRDGFEKSRFADWNLIKVDLIELPDNELQYRVGVGKGDFKKRNLYFNSKGRMLKDKLTL